MASQTIQIADKPTLDEVLALLEDSDCGNGALKNLISTVSKQTTADTIQSLLQNSTYGLSALKNLLGTVNTNTASVKSVVKSVQKGTFTFNNTTGIGDKTITISSITPSKAICILDSSGNQRGNECWVKSLNSNSLVIAIHPGSTASVNTGSSVHTYGSWQVIEFY